jgi:hypothetical protein
MINNLHRDNEVESRARAIFRTACENADSYHLLRLGFARRKALNASAAGFATRLRAPAAGIAVACCALAVAVALLRPVARTAPPTNIAATTSPAPEQVIDALPEVGNNPVEMVQNLDFYRWLAAQPAVAAAAPRSGQ